MDTKNFIKKWHEARSDLNFNTDVTPKNTNSNNLKQVEIFDMSAFSLLSNNK